MSKGEKTQITTEGSGPCVLSRKVYSLDGKKLGVLKKVLSDYMTIIITLL